MKDMPAASTDTACCAFEGVTCADTHQHMSNLLQPPCKHTQEISSHPGVRAWVRDHYMQAAKVSTRCTTVGVDHPLMEPYAKCVISVCLIHALCVYVCVCVCVDELRFCD